MQMENNLSFHSKTKPFATIIVTKGLIQVRPTRFELVTHSLEVRA